MQFNSKNMKHRIGIGITTCPDENAALEIVESLLRSNLIACGQVEGPLKSIYRWDGRLNRETEWKVTLKFKLSNLDDLGFKLREIHPYDVPQWVAWDAEASEEYGKWVDDPTEKG